MIILGEEYHETISAVAVITTAHTSPLNGIWGAWSRFKKPDALLVIQEIIVVCNTLGTYSFEIAQGEPGEENAIIRMAFVIAKKQKRKPARMAFLIPAPICIHRGGDVSARVSRGSGDEGVAIPMRIELW